MTPAFFINLDRDTDRRRSIETQLSSAQLDAERIQAVAGRNLPEWAQPYFPHCSLTPGEVGCYASHMLAWRTIVARNLPFALVLEDDALIDDGASRLIDELVNTLPRGWDFVHLDGRSRSRAFSSRPLRDLPEGRRLLRYARIPDGTLAYLISNQGARKLLVPTPRTVPVDTDTRRPWLWGLDLYGVSNPPFRPAGFASGIDSRSRLSRKRWYTSEFRSVRSFAFNLWKLGPYWWVTCYLQNCIAKAGRQRLTAQRSPTHPK